MAREQHTGEEARWLGNSILEKKLDAREQHTGEEARWLGNSILQKKLDG
jgi:hypothetical protein